MTNRAREHSRHWEDVVLGAKSEYGPFSVTEEQLDRYLDLSHERFPIHVDDSFARTAGHARRLVPGRLIHSVIAGGAGTHLGYLAVVCVRWARYDYHAPVFVGDRFVAKSRIALVEPVDEKYGVVEHFTEVCAVEGPLLTTARVNVLILRRGSS